MPRPKSSTRAVFQTPSDEDVLQGRGYKLLEVIGSGAYGQIHSALTVKESMQRRRRLACKVIDTERVSEEFTNKFLPREISILCQLNHPYIVRAHYILRRRKRYFIFMGFAENGDVLDFVIANGAVVEEQARVWMRQVMLALLYLHDLDIAHRDLKCENLLLSSKYNVKLADFGFARRLLDADGRYVPSETFCGSLAYAAPELVSGCPYNPKLADLWSLGVVAYVMLNREMPFDDRDVLKLYTSQINRKWNFRLKLIDVLSRQVKKFVRHLLEPDVRRRWQLAQALNSSWIAMDSRLVWLTPAEQRAHAAALRQRRVSPTSYPPRTPPRPSSSGARVSLATPTSAGMAATSAPGAVTMPTTDAATTTAAAKTPQGEDATNINPTG